MDTPLNVAILVYPGVEMIDMNGPADVFIKANNLNGGKYRLYTVAENNQPLISEASIVAITPAYSITNCPSPDIIVIPGQILSEDTYQSGSGSPALIDWLIQVSQKTGIIIMSVCVGAYILAKTGLLTGKKATTHYDAIDYLQKQYAKIQFIKNVRYVQDGNFITTGGITSGIDGALHLIEQLDSPDIAQQVANVMVYNTKAPLPPGTILPT